MKDKNNERIKRKISRLIIKEMYKSTILKRFKKILKNNGLNSEVVECSLDYVK